MPYGAGFELSDFPHSRTEADATNASACGRTAGHVTGVAKRADSRLDAECQALEIRVDILIQMNHVFSGNEPSAAFRAACGHHRGNAGSRVMQA
jgi:hypothetical protein